MFTNFVCGRDHVDGVRGRFIGYISFCPWTSRTESRAINLTWDAVNVVPTTNDQMTIVG